jgi:hypothetical protein
VSVSRYEKYIVRKAAVPADLTPYLKEGIIPSRFLDGKDGLIKEADSMAEYTWITQDCSMGHSEGRGPHKHDFGELFLFMGTNPEDQDDLGAEVELWLGEGEETDKLNFNTSSLIYVPGGMMHMPIFFKNVKRPFLRLTIGLNTGDKRCERFPPRNI